MTFHERYLGGCAALALAALLTASPTHAQAPTQPTDAALNAEAAQNDWPTHHGTYKSYHVFGKYTDFSGAYWHNDDFGMVRYATHDEKAGKKLWIWGLSGQGMIWDHLLTDTDGDHQW